MGTSATGDSRSAAKLRAMIQDLLREADRGKLRFAYKLLKALLRWVGAGRKCWGMRSRGVRTGRSIVPRASLEDLENIS